MAGLLGSGSLYAAPVINEIDPDTPGSDTAEFIEIFDAPNTPLDGYVIVLYNGSDDLSYNAFNLDGFSTDENGYFVAGNAAVAGVDMVISNGSLQNGADAVALYTGDAVDFPNDTPITLTNLVDVIVYGTNDGDDAGLLTGFGETVQHNDATDSTSISREPDGSETFSSVFSPTPGASNGTPPLSLSVDPTFADLDETGGVSSATITVTLSEAPASYPVTLTLTSSDTTEATVPATVDVTAGLTTTFDITVVDDTLMDGDKLVTVTVQNADYGDDSVDVTVFDDGDTEPVPMADLLITQYYEGSSNNKYIEITNVGNTTADLSQYYLTVWSNAATEDWKTGAGTPNNDNALLGSLAPGETYIYANPSATTPINPADADQAGTSTFFNGNDSVVLYFGNTWAVADILDAVSFTEAGNEGGNTSFARISTDVGYNTTAGSTVLDFPTVWQQFTNAEVDAAAAPANEHLGSSSFGVATPSVVFSVASSTVAEGTATHDIEIKILSPDGNEVSVDVALDGTSTADAADFDSYTTQTVTFPATASDGDTMNVTLTVTDDAEGEGNETAIFNLENLVTAGSVVIGGANTHMVTLEDNDDLVLPNLVINEVDADIAGEEVFEFIELFGDPNLNLDGLVLLLVNGNGESVYQAIDLTGFSTDANGYFVIGDGDVTGVDLIPSGWDAQGAVTGTHNLQNGVDGVALFVGTTTEFPNGTVVSVTPNLVDAIVYDSGTDTDAELLTALGVTTAASESAGGDREAHSVSRFPNGVGEFGATTPTPGAENTDVVVPPVADGIEIVSCSFDRTTNVGEVVFTEGATAFYFIEYSTDLINWTQLPAPYDTENNLGDGTIRYIFTDAGAAGEDKRFYRVTEDPSS